MRPVLLALAWLLLPVSARAIDGTEPQLRLGLLGGLSGTLPVGERRASGAARDEVLPALWVQLEPLLLELDRRWAFSTLVRFRVAGGVSPRAIEGAISSTARPAGSGLGAAEPSLLQLGLLGRRYFGSGALQPVLSLLGAYATMGAHYQTVPQGAAALVPNARPSARVHRHRGAALGAGLGVRYAASFRAFEQEVSVPVLLELHYVHDFWTSLQRRESLESGPNPLLGARPVVDFVGLSLTVGYLR